MSSQTTAAPSSRKFSRGWLVVVVVGGVGSASCTETVTLKSDPVSIWLASQDDGWCSQQYNQRIDVCGDVQYCGDGYFMKPYPTGVAFDIGFYWDGTDTGNLFDFGRDKTGKRATVRVSESGTLSASGPGDAPEIAGPIAGGRHLVSYYVAQGASALYLDGTLVGSSSGSASPIDVGSGVNGGGPGFTLGSRLSTESVPGPESWLKFVVFFFHMRENVATPITGDFSEVSAPQPESRVFFDSMTERTATTWSSVVGGRVAVTKSGPNQTGPLWFRDYEATCP